MPISLLPRSRRARAAAILVIAVPLLAGCSAASPAAHSTGSSSKSSSSGSSSFQAKEPCDYLSDAQASAAIGTKLTSSEAGGACSYSGAHLAGFADTITGISGANDPIWKQEVQSLKDEAGKATPIPGVGDEAYSGRGSVEEKIVVRSGNAAIEIADADGDANNFTKSIAVAKAIIANLGN